jgi:alanine dehydrogenase
VKQLTKAGHPVLIEKDAGLSAGYTDAAYSDSGAEIIIKRDKLFHQAEVLLMVRGPGANPI